jgi:ribonuclease D
MAEHTWIERPEQLDELVQAVADARWLALDTESNSMFVYRERICLLQVNAGGRLFLVDTLALPYAPATYAGLKPTLEDPARRIYLHGGEYDVACLRRDFGIGLTGVWDSQQAASFLGWEKTGYGSVVERICAVPLDKSFAQYDWGTRPLDPQALRYALDDVVYLTQVCEHLEQLVHEQDIEEEIAIANGAVMGSGWSGGFDPEGFWRIKGVRELGDRQLSLIATLYAWRDAVAQRHDKPPGRIINNEVLLSLARTGPTNFGGVKRAGLKSWLVAEHGDELIAVVKDHAQKPLQVPRRASARQVDQDESLRETRLKDWRRGEAERRKVPLQLVLPAKALEHLKQFGAGNLEAVPQLGAKRIRTYGDKLRTLCG